MSSSLNVLKAGVAAGFRGTAGVHNARRGTALEQVQQQQGEVGVAPMLDANHGLQQAVKCLR